MKIIKSLLRGCVTTTISKYSRHNISINFIKRLNRIQNLTIIVFINLLIFNSSFALNFVVNDLKQPIISGTHSIGDLNGDGLDDIFVSGLVVWGGCGYFYHSFSCYRIQIDERTKILINNGKGAFEEKQQIEAAFYQKGTYGQGLFPVPNGSIIKDVNNDGHNDILSPKGILYINNGDAQFEKGIDLKVEYVADAIERINVADLDNDGTVEILSFGRIYKNTNDDLQFIFADNSFVWSPYKDIKLADFNNDGYIDIITYGNNENIEILYNNDGEFNGQKLTFEEKEPINLITGDIDNDGDIDIVLSSGKVLRNDSSFTFVVTDNIIDLASNYDELDVPSYVPLQLINYNGDEFLDLYVSYYTAKDLYSDSKFIDRVLINDGNGRFFNDSSKFFSHSTNKTIVSFTGDFNSDDLMDFIVSDSDTDVDNFGVFAPRERVFPVMHSESEGLRLFINNIGSINPSINSTISYSKNFLVDFNNNNVKELLIGVSKSYYLYNLPSYISAIRGLNYEVNEIESLYYDGRYIVGVIPGDFSGNGYDDLLVRYFSFENSYEQKIFYNSTSGFSAENTSNLILRVPGNYTKVADVNGDGKDDIVYGKTVYISNGEQFQDYSFATSNPSNIKVEDINGDGFSDMVFLTSQEDVINIVYGQSDMSQTLSSKIINREVFEVDLFDYNDDGLLDVFAFEEDNRLRIIKQNTDGSFSYDRTIQFPFNQPIRNFKIADLNNDGKFDVLSMTDFDSEFYIYQQVSNDSFKTVYKNNEFVRHVSNDYIVHDFDGDSLLDISIGNKIILSRKQPIGTGLNYDSTHSGHGFSIENIGAEDQFYSVFYTYGNDGFPEWYADLGLLTDDIREDYWRISGDDMDVIKFNYDYENSEAIPLTDSQHIGYLSHDDCSDSIGSINLSYGLGLGHTGLPAEKGKWCSQSIIDYYQRPESDLSGLWWAGAGDSGWGFSIGLAKRETTTDMVVVLYYYDGEGKPRWLIGQQSGFEVGQEITLDMDMIKGYAREAIPRGLERFAAGTMSLILNQPSQNLLNAGTLSIDVTYPGSEGGRWVRESVPIALFTNPR